MGSKPQSAPEKPSPWIARQPILALDESVVGYELLFRENAEERRFLPDAPDATTNPDSATLAAIDTLNLIGFEVLCDGRAAFINCTHPMLLKGYFSLLPPADTVVEIDEAVPADGTVEDVCQRLKQAGYRIALDHYVPGDAREPLVAYADFLKVDIKRLGRDDCADLARRHAAKHRRMLALKVESREDFVTAKQAGYSLFQGYFFRRPEHLQARQIPANQATFLRLLQAISKPQLDFAEIEDLIKHEPSLCYRLLRYLNSPLLGLASPVQSVRHALNLLGERESVRWIRMATTLVMGQEKSSDLVLSSLVRARFCEMLAPKVKHGQSDLFLLGMLSLMDAILELPIGILVEELSLDADIKAQLISGKTGTKTPLSPIYDLMVAREAGDWGAVTALGKQLNLSLYFMAESYNAAMKWGHQMTSAGRVSQTPAR
jgi:c-di-GMP-related signal transduction protein